MERSLRAVAKRAGEMGVVSADVDIFCCVGR